MENEYSTELVIGDPNQIEMFDFKDRMDPELADALVEFQGKMKRVKKDGKSFTGKYATYDDIIDAIREVAPECGITPFATIQGDYLICQVLHRNGSLSPATKVKFPEEHSLGKGNDMQGFGSDITYLKRYIISLMFNIATGEDKKNMPGGEDTDMPGGEDTDGHVPGTKDKKPKVLDPTTATKNKKVTTENIEQLKVEIQSAEVMPALKALWNNNGDFLKAVEKKFPDLMKDLEDTYETKKLTIT